MTNEVDLTPTEYLVMEVLIARYRLGEEMWTFPSRFKPQAESLEKKGLVGWKSGIIEKTIVLHLDDGFMLELPEYTAPVSVPNKNDVLSLKHYLTAHTGIAPVFAEQLAAMLCGYYGKGELSLD